MVLALALIGAGVLSLRGGLSLPRSGTAPSPSSVPSSTTVVPHPLGAAAAAELASPPHETAAAVTVTPKPPETVSPTPTDESSAWSGALNVRKPTLNEIRAEDPVSLWDANLINVRDMRQPGTDGYRGKARVGEDYLFPVYWCGTSSELLVENMDLIDTTILVNGEPVPDKYIFEFDLATDSGWVCRYHAVVLGGWKSGLQYTLDIKRAFGEEVFDGETVYPAGEYVYKLTVEVP